MSGNFLSDSKLSIGTQNEHDHLPYNNNGIEKEVVQSRAKRKATKDKHAKPNKIIRHELLGLMMELSFIEVM